MAKQNIFKNYVLNQAAEKELLQKDGNDQKSYKNDDVVIAVLDRGWVFVGAVTTMSNGDIRLDNAFNIHRWGTEKGLGQLAIEGPLSQTVLYDAGVVFGKPIVVFKTDYSLWNV